MAQRSSIYDLPPEIKKWLDDALIEGNFSAYQALETAIKAKGYDISKSAIHRYGQKIERRMASIKASTEAAKLIAEGAADDEDHRSTAVIAMLQSEIFEVLMSLQDLENTDSSEHARLLGQMAKAVSELTRASIVNKKYASDVKTRLDAKFDEISKANKMLDPQLLERIRREVYGVL